MFENYQPMYGQLGLTMPMAGNDSGTDQFIQPNYANFDDNGSNDFLQSIGYTGATPYQQAGPGNDGGPQGANGYSPEFLNFLQSKGLTLQQSADPSKQGNNLVRAVDGGGNQVGNTYQHYLGNNDVFGAAMAAAGLFAGGAALGAGAAGGAGGGAAAGGGGAGLSADSLAYGALENGAAYGGGYGAPLTASSEAGFGGALGEGAGALGAEGGADLGAFEGVGSGAGGSGAAAGNGGWLSSLGDAAGDVGSWAKANPGLVNMGGNALNALIGAYSGQKALGRQTDATNAANALWAPYRDFGVQNLGRANGLLQNPSSITSDPGYQFTTQQGVQALDRSAASKGGLYSGAQMKASQRFGQDNANNYFDKILGRYTGAAQLGATGTTNISNNLTNLGNAGAGAAMYQGNVANSAVNNALGQWNFQNGGYGVPWNQSQYGKPPGG